MAYRVMSSLAGVMERGGSIITREALALVKRGPSRLRMLRVPSEGANRQPSTAIRQLVNHLAARHQRHIACPSSLIRPRVLFTVNCFCLRSSCSTELRLRSRLPRFVPSPPVWLIAYLNPTVSLLGAFSLPCRLYARWAPSQTALIQTKQSLLLPKCLSNSPSS